MIKLIKNTAIGYFIFIFGLSLSYAQPAAAQERQLETDVVVVGFGGAGVSASVSAAEAGLKVIALEKQAFAGGSTNFAEGLFGIGTDQTRYRLGFSPGTLQSLGVQQVMAFLSAYQDADCALSEHADIECEARVANGSLDMAIAVRPGDNSPLSYTSIKQERIVLVSNRKHRLARLAQTRPVRLTDMLDVSLIMLDETFRLQETMLQHLRRAGVTPHIYTHISHDLHVAYDLVTLDQGVFVFVEGLARPLLREEMVSIPLTDAGMTWDIGLIVSHESASRAPPLLNFIDRFQHEMRRDREASRRKIGGAYPLFI